MSGHSKWSTIKHKKGAADAKRGKLFGKLIKEITMAARTGGGDPGGNPRLRTALLAARAANMPADNITRAIKKGTGDLPGETYEDFLYEVRGPVGIAVIIEGTTDNKNRTVAEIRHLLDRNGGTLEKTGGVMYLFEKKGSITLENPTQTADELMEIALEAGAEDIEIDGESCDIITDPATFEAVREAVIAKGLTPSAAEVSLQPKITVPVNSESDARKVLRLMEALEAHDDVSKVSANFDIPDEILEAAG
jgi:YebC/PmpR family DNA-binding regulatory protein